jgi:undecaprenyl-diphosphatase
MQKLEYAILGIIQGITEFLPISSSGHILIGRYFFNINHPGINIEVFLHTGTLLSIILFWYQDILYEINELKNGKRLFIISLIIGTIPAGIIGLTFNSLIEDYFFNSSSLSFLSYNYLLLGVILFSSKFIKNNSNESISYKNAFLIGIAQACAILPGLSRSGLTIVMAMYLGISFKSATKFSFLLAIPILVFATFNTMLSDYSNFYNNINSTQIVIGFILSFIIGYLTLGLLQRIIKNQKLWYFSFYCLIIGLILFYVV